MKAMIGKLSSWFKDVFEINNNQSFSSNLIQLLNIIWEQNLPQLYVIIDEYDNFANQMIMSSKEKQYKNLRAPSVSMLDFNKNRDRIPPLRGVRA